MSMNPDPDKKDSSREGQTLPNELSGWAFLEEYTRRHDTSFVKDFSDDIDTMLVFAGLFSAVVTTLVGISYLLLQPDSSQPVLQRLDRISTQLESFTTSPGLTQINSTIPTSIPHPSTFIPTASARWVNILWFLSLVLSLTAALFGIHAKQWLREYMQWNAILGAPRENILVRQIRFEAWNDWNVPAMIATIPALLELAVIMFLVGLLLFLWTLDPIVAIVITIVVAIVILITIALTIAPAFWIRCPYKSPTAWAVVLLWDLIRSGISHMSSYWRRFLALILGGHSANLPPLDPKDYSLTIQDTSRYTWRQRHQGKRPVVNTCNYTAVV